jgi:hemerythrin-like metal-binding protein
MFEWSPNYSVGIGSIDAQHQGLFAIAHELYTAMSAGQGKNTLSRLLDRLVQYTAVHFAHEERLMRQYGYPMLEKHRLEHQKLTAQVEEFQREFRAGRVALTVQLLKFLKEWLQHHIQESDRAYAPYLKSRPMV